MGDSLIINDFSSVRATIYLLNLLYGDSLATSLAVVLYPAISVAEAHGLTL